MSYANPITGESQDTNPNTGLTDYELEQHYNDMLDDVYGVVTIAGYQYETSRVLKEVDPIAYRVGLSDYESFREEI
jgi:hypothetical protein